MKKKNIKNIIKKKKKEVNEKVRKLIKKVNIFDEEKNQILLNR